MLFFDVKIRAKSKKVLLRHMLSVMKSMVNDYYQHDTQDCKYNLSEVPDVAWEMGDLERIKK
jgi:hypothetical protein